MRPEDVKKGDRIQHIHPVTGWVTVVSVTQERGLGVHGFYYEYENERGWKGVEISDHFIL